MSRYNVRYRPLPRTVKEIEEGEQFSLNGKDWYICVTNKWRVGYVEIEQVEMSGQVLNQLRLDGNDRCVVSTVVIPIHIGGTVDVDIKAWAREYGMEALPKPVVDDARVALALESLIPAHLRGIVHTRED